MRLLEHLARDHDPLALALLDAGDAATCAGGAQSDRDGVRLLVVEQE